MENIKKTKAKNLEIWLAWLATNHSHTQRVWLIIAKKNSSIESISMSEAIAGALCYGWVDSRKRASTRILIWSTSHLGDPIVNGAKPIRRL